MVEIDVLSRFARSWLDATWLLANHSVIFSRRSAGTRSSTWFESISVNLGPNLLTIEFDKYGALQILCRNGKRKLTSEKLKLAG
jgi:hypothetical protein